MFRTKKAKDEVIVEKKAPNELGRLAKNQFCAVEKLSARIDDTGSVAESLIDIMENISEGVENQKTEISHVVEEMSNYTALAEEVQASISNTQEITREASEGIRVEGSRMVQVSVGAIEQIRDSVKIAEDIVEALNHQISKIDEMSNVITEISGQTNLLSLNARIEAARAGEAGRGFAVVANEVNKLAEESATSAEDISRISEDIKKGIKSAVDAMKTSMDKVEIGIKTTEDMDSIFKNIIQSMDRVSNVTGEINEAVSHQSQSLTSVMNASYNMDEMSENVLQMTEVALMNTGYTKSAINQLEKDSDYLKKLTKKMNEKMIFGDEVSILKTQVSTDDMTLDPIMPFDQATMVIISNCHTGLLTIGAKNEMFPAVAKSWQVESDNKTWVFNIRRGVKFHDGSMLSVEDIAFSLKRLLDPKMQSPNAWFLFDIKGAEDYNQGLKGDVEGIQVVDQNRIKIELKHVNPGFLLNLTQPCCTVISKKKYAQGEIVGCGPYIAECSEGMINLASNINYFGGRPYSDQMIIQTKDDDYLESFKSGKYDFVQLRDTQKIPEFKKLADTEVRILDQMATEYMGFNFNRSNVFSKDKRVRQALNYAFDNMKYIEEKHYGTAEAAKGVFPKNVLEDLQLKGYPYDLTRAKSLLRDSDYRDETLTILVRNTGSNTLMEHVEMAANAIGIKTKLISVESKLYMKPETVAKADMFALTWLADTGDPDNFLTPLLVPGSYANFGAYNNSEMNEKMTLAKQIVNPKHRNEAYQEIQSIVVEDAPWLFATHPKQIYLTRKHVEGFGINSTGIPIYENIMIYN